jgi:hypothetical protein
MTRVTEVVTSHVAVPETLGRRDKFGRVGFVDANVSSLGTGTVQCAWEVTGRDRDDGAFMA